VVAAELEILTKGPVPPDAPQGIPGDLPDLGITIARGEWKIQGNIVARGTLLPKGVHVGRVVKGGWYIRRELQGHVWNNGEPVPNDARFWTDPAWYDDTTGYGSREAREAAVYYLKIEPDDQDHIYDRDTPDIVPMGQVFEAQDNFRQWVEWNIGDKECGGPCSDYANWHFTGIIERGLDGNPHVVGKPEVDKGHMTLTAKATRRPRKPGP
jgi:hypothetical protein